MPIALDPPHGAPGTAAQHELQRLAQEPHESEWEAVPEWVLSHGQQQPAVAVAAVADASRTAPPPPSSAAAAVAVQELQTVAVGRPYSPPPPPPPPPPQLPLSSALAAVLTLSEQLSRGHTLQQQLQDSLHQALGQLGRSQCDADQVADEARQELRRWQGEPAALVGMAADELGVLVSALEGSLSRVRTAHTQAVADAGMCPVCLHDRKDTVFQCGHQTCGGCSGKVDMCPICRVPITVRIKIY